MAVKNPSRWPNWYFCSLHILSDKLEQNVQEFRQYSIIKDLAR